MIDWNMRICAATDTEPYSIHRIDLRTLLNRYKNLTFENIISVFDDQCRDEAAEPDLSSNRKHQPVPTLWNEPRLVTVNGCFTSNTEDHM